MEEEEGQSENKQAQSPSIRCAPPDLLRFKLWHGRATLGVCGWDFLLQNADRLGRTKSLELIGLSSTLKRGP